MPSRPRLKKRSPSPQGDERGLPLGPTLAGGAAFVLSWCVVSFASFFQPWLYGDVRFYENWGNWTATHLMPYRDFSLEYPPGALLSFLFPLYARKAFGYIWTYYIWFRIELLLIGLLVIVVAAWALRLVGASRRRAYAALVFMGIAPLMLGPIALARYDYLPALLTVLALALALSGRERTACGVLAAGFVVKIYPAFLIPIVLVALWRKRGKRGVLEGVGVSFVVALAGFLPFMLLAWHGLKHGMERQTIRPPQIESFVAALWVGAHWIGGLHIHSVKSYGSDNFTTPGAQLAGTLASVLVVVLLLWILIVYARSNGTREDLVLAFAASVAAYVTFAKVLSPQYLVWLFPLIPLVAGRRGLWATAALGVATMLTGIWEPYKYGDLFRHFTLEPSLLMIVRDCLLVAMLAVLVWPRPLERHAEQLDPARATVV
jgi:Glycosyltransferase family 87